MTLDRHAVNPGSIPGASYKEELTSLINRCAGTSLKTPQISAYVYLTELNQVPGLIVIAGHLAHTLSCSTPQL